MGKKRCEVGKERYVIESISWFFVSSIVDFSVTWDVFVEFCEVVFENRLFFCIVRLCNWLFWEIVGLVSVFVGLGS